MILIGHPWRNEIACVPRCGAYVSTKKQAAARRLYLMHDILSRLHYVGLSKLLPPDRNMVFEFTPYCVATQLLALRP